MGLMTHSGAVSYTHLDVYKRQGGGSGGAGKAGAGRRMTEKSKLGGRNGAVW